MKNRHPLLYRVRSDQGELAEFLVPFRDGTTFARLCIEHGVDIVGIGEPLPGTTEHALCGDYNWALATLVAGPHAEEI